MGMMEQARLAVRTGLRLCAVAAALFAPGPVHAASTATFIATADQPLRFGTMVTANAGSRTVGADGSTSNNGVFPLGDSVAGPAQFTMTYTRASGDHNCYQLVFQFSLPSVSPAKSGGIQGSLSAFTTDLAGVPVLSPGQTASTTLPTCVAASCSVTFHVGATLNVVRSTGGASLAFPLVLLTTVTTVFG